MLNVYVNWLCGPESFTTPDLGDLHLFFFI